MRDSSFQSSVFDHLRCAALVVALGTVALSLQAADRLAYLEERNPYYPDLNFPKLTTPMWVGEPGVEAVVLLSVDDMAGGVTPPNRRNVKITPDIYQSFLRPLVTRLKQIDGRAPISIFTLKLEPSDAVVDGFLRDGFSIEAHGFTHPVPLMRTSAPPAPPGPESLALASEDFVLSVDSLNRAAGVTPLSWRTPGCDARNTNSIRFMSEVLPRRTPKGNFLSADSSIFMWFTPEDKSLPPEVVRHPDGTDRFGKFMNAIRSAPNFVNWVSNYPYPFVFNRFLWEFPPIVPADSHGVHVHKHNSPNTVEDWKRVLDGCVVKKGLFTLCFHTYGYIRADQLVEVIDYADRTYGKRIKFLNLREVYGRLTQNFLGEEPLRTRTGADNGVRVLDVNNDGYVDVVIGNARRRETRIWEPKSNTWKITKFPVGLVGDELDGEAPETGAKFFVASPDGKAGLAIAAAGAAGVWVFEDGEWKSSRGKLPAEVDGAPLLTATRGVDRGVRFRDLDGDGCSDLIVRNDTQNAVYFWRPATRRWDRAPFALPGKARIVDASGADDGTRFLDLDHDGDLDIVYSNEREFGVYVFEGPTRGWARAAREGLAGSEGAPPPITRRGALNGVHIKSGALILVNEFTAIQPFLMERTSFEELLGAAPTGTAQR